MLGIHHGEACDVVQAEIGDTLARLAQHRFGDVNAEDPAARRIVGKRYAGADADFQDACTDLRRNTAPKVRS